MFTKVKLKIEAQSYLGLRQHFNFLEDLQTINRVKKIKLQRQNPSINFY